MKLDECRAELEAINRDLAWDIMDEKRVKELNKKLKELGYEIQPRNSYLKIERSYYTTPDQRKLVFG